MNKRAIYLFVVLVLLLVIFGCGKRKTDKENITVVFGENRTEVVLENISIIENQSEENLDFTKIHEENSDLDFLGAVLEDNERIDSELEEVSNLIRQ